MRSLYDMRHDPKSTSSCSSSSSTGRTKVGSCEDNTVMKGVVVSVEDKEEKEEEGK